MKKLECRSTMAAFKAENAQRGIENLIEVLECSEKALPEEEEDARVNENERTRK